jgi:hypothetical protein
MRMGMGMLRWRVRCMHVRYIDGVLGMGWRFDRGGVI